MNRPQVAGAPAVLDRLLSSAMIQAIGLALAMLAVTSLGWNNDGLWFQGDSPRHAATGLYMWDLLKAIPVDPIGYSLAYYARYPVITPLLYPPLFHLSEGIAFAVAGPSPWAAKAVVLTSCAVLGLYTLMWGRRWIAPVAGWAGPLSVLLPGLAVYANVVEPNVPATALGFASLFHLRRWLDGGLRLHRNVFVGLGIATVLTYYPGVIAMAVAMVWVLVTEGRHGGRLVVKLAAVGVAAILLLSSVLPAHLLRNLPSPASLFSASDWAFYPAKMPKLLGPAAAVALLGLICTGMAPSRRREAIRLALAVATVIACLVALPPKDPRYALLVVPFAAIGLLSGIVVCAEAVEAHRQTVLAIGLLAAAASILAVFLDTTLDKVSGFDRVARYLASHGESDAVLYDGNYDGVFAFYLRAHDPQLQRRVVFAHKLLYQFELDSGFTRTEKPLASNREDLVALIAGKSGCNWIALEVRPDEYLTASGRLLRNVVDGPGFERVASFPIEAPLSIRVDLYRITLPVASVPAQDIAFPSFAERLFHNVEPIRQKP